MIERLAAQVIGHRSRALRVPEELGGATLARRIARQLAKDGHQIIELIGLPELRGIELAAFAPLLAGADPDEPVAGRLHRLYSALAPSRARAVLVVDGAPDLDEISAAVVHQLVRAYGVRALLIGPGPLPEALMRLAAVDHLAELEDLQSPADHDALRFQTILRALGVASTTDLEWAARAARADGDPDLGARLARRALSAAAERDEPRPSGALVVLADGLSLTGRLDEADAAYAEALAEAEGTDLVEAAELAAFHWAVRRHDIERAAAAVTGALDRVADPAARAALELARAEVRFMAGGGAPPAPTEEAAAGLRALIFRMHSGVFIGDLVDARAAIALARPIVRDRPDPSRPLDEVVEFCAYLVLVAEARLGDAEAAAHALRRERGASADGMWDYAIALPRFLAGDLPAAIRAAERGVARLTERDYINAAGPTRGLHATALAAAGRHAAARLALETIPRQDRLANVATDLQAAEAEAWLLAAEGDLDAAAATIALAAVRGVETNHTTFAALTAATAVRLGRPQTVLDVLRDAARHAPDAALVPLLRDYAEAAVADAEALLAIAPRLAAAGLLGAAADAASAAAERGIGEALGLAAGYRAGSAAGTRVEGAGLSRREWEVAAAAAERLRNREIADRFGLSVRTVENYLASAFRKLGVDRRDELAARLS